MHICLTIIPWGCVLWILADHDLDLDSFADQNPNLFDVVFPALSMLTPVLKVSECLPCSQNCLHIAGIAVCIMCVLVAVENAVRSYTSSRKVGRVKFFFWCVGLGLHIIVGILHDESKMEQLLGAAYSLVTYVPVVVLVFCAGWLEERHKQYRVVGRGPVILFNFVNAAFIIFLVPHFWIQLTEWSLLLGYAVWSSAILIAGIIWGWVRVYLWVNTGFIMQPG